MDSGIIATRYAKALFSTGDGDFRTCARMARELTKLEDQLEYGFNEIMENPRFKKSERKRIIEKFCKEFDFLPVTERFILLIVEKDRFPLFPDIVRLFTHYLDEMIERVVVTVISSEKLPSDIAIKYMDQIQQVVGHSALLKQVVDPEFIGGVKIIIKNRMIDGTVLGMFGRFREQMGIPRER